MCYTVCMAHYLFQYYPEEKFQEVLRTYHVCTDLHVQLLSEDGNVLINEGTSAPFCAEIMKHLPDGDTCMAQHLKAGKQALRFGEAYLFDCHAGLYHIVFPILNKKTMLGSVIAGPFLMDEPDASLILELSRKYDLDTRSLLSLSEHSYQLKTISPELAQEYKRLLYYLVSSLTSTGEELMSANNTRLLQQSRINESIQLYKNSGVRDTLQYPLHLESRLITKIKTGDLQKARKTLNELFAYLLLYEGHDIRRIRVRIVELCSLLSRAAIEHGSDVDRILDLNEKLISSILIAKDVYEISYILHDNMDIFTESLFYTSDKGNSLIRNATEYIAVHFSEEITLTDVAEAIHLNATYLSTLFRQVTGRSFKDYLNQVRIREAQHLLKNTDYPIMEISIACGFSDQSYFTKVFRKYTGLTPKQYR